MSREQLLALNQQVLAIGERHALQADYEKTIVLLGGLKSGAISLDDFVLVNNGWQFVLDRPSPVPAILESPTATMAAAAVQAVEP